MFSRKCPEFDAFRQVKTSPNQEKIKKPWQTVVSSEGDQGTCKIWGYFFPISSQDNAQKHFGWTVSRSHIPFWFENFIRISYSLETKRPPLLGTKRAYALGRFSPRFCQVVSWLKIVIIVVLNILNWYRGVIWNFVIKYNRMDKGLGQYAKYMSGNLLGMFGNMILRIVG